MYEQKIPEVQFVSFDYYVVEQMSRVSEFEECKWFKKMLGKSTTWRC